MTVQESTICSLIQTFPVLLILAQNHNRCVKTPLIYKPPSPTQSPEYYQALDALIHNLYGHESHHETGYHDHHKYPGYLCYGYNERKYPEGGHGRSGYGTPCYNYGYATTGHGLGHGHTTTGHGFGHEHTATGHELGLGYPYNFGHHSHGQQYPVYGFKKVNVYNVSKGYGVKGYAPNQVYNLNHKYKVVVKRNKVPSRRRFEKLTAGFFENQPRDERRYSPHGFSQNSLPIQNRYRNQVSGIVHLRPENQNSNPAYIYPFANQRGMTYTGYYDQYGRYQQNQNYPDYGQQNYPQGQNYPDYSRPNYYQQNQYNPNNAEYNNNGNPVPFPTNNEIPNNNDRIIIVVQEESDDRPVPMPENVISEQEKKTEYFAEDKGVIFPPQDKKKNYFEGYPDVPSSTDTSKLPSLTPVPPSEIHIESLPFPPVTYNPSPTFTSLPTNSEYPSYKPDLETERKTVIPPLQPVEASNFNNSLMSIKPESPEPNLSPLQPIEPSNPNNGFMSFNAESPESGLLPVQPVQPSNPNIGFSSYKPDSHETNFPPLQPAEPSDPNNGFSSFKPSLPKQDSLSLQPVNPGDPATSYQTTLPPLTPVPSTESRNNFNFGPAGIFQTPCQTVEGGVGSCVSLYDCEPYLSMLQQTRSDSSVTQLLRKAHCGFDGNNPKVCCPRPGIPTTRPEIPTASPTTTTTTTTTPSPKTKTTCPAQTYSVAPEDRVPALPEAPVCGLSAAAFSRVVGGVDAKLGDFPFMALLGYRNARKTTSWLCGGSLITSKHVLTAAHCINCREERLYVVRLGELDLSREDEGATPVDVLVKTHVIHKGYDANSVTNDIGLLVLRNEVQFTNLIRPVCLPQSPELRSLTFERYNPLLAGWGDKKYQGPQAEILQVLQLPVVSNEHCKQKYVKYKSQVIDDRVLCAGYKIGGKDACQGDSGGPLMQPISRPDIKRTMNQTSFYFYQIGVVSYGFKCAEPDFPGVYTRVTYFMPWLEEQLLTTR